MNVIKAVQELIMRYAASGREYLSEWYMKVESNFVGLKTWTDSHLRGDAGYRHNADDVDYSGSIPQGNTVKDVLENTHVALNEEKQDRIAEDAAIRQELQAETAERKSEDDRLNTALETEVTAREIADSALQTALDLEADIRSSEDSMLRAEIQEGLEQEKQERTIEEEALRAALVEETSERESATAELQSSINAEKTAREQAEADIYDAIDAERVERERVDDALRNAIGSGDVGGGGGTTAIVEDITIPSAGWTEDASENADFHYYLDIFMINSLSNRIPIVTIYPNSLSIAEKAGMCSTVQTLDGAIRFWTENIPGGSIKATVALLIPGDGESSGDYVLPTATAERLGGVKIGDGIEVADDGTISSDGTISPSDIATPEETQEMLDDIFNNEK